MRKFNLFMTAIAITLLTGCAASTQKAPCPDFGTSCIKKPVNSWDYQR